MESHCAIACFPRRSILSEVDKQKSVVLVVSYSPVLSLMKDLVWRSHTLAYTRVYARVWLRQTMKDRVRAMTKKNMTAVFGSDEDAHSEICHSKYQLVFVSPMALLGNDSNPFHIKQLGCFRLLCYEETAPISAVRPHVRCDQRHN